MAGMIRRFVVPAAVFLASGLGLPVCLAVEYDVYILTGQSNSLGTTGSGDTLVAPGADAADDETAFFWSNVSSTNTLYPPVL
jgi:hypothetical protein